MTAFNMPFLELLPRLDEKEYQELKADIQQRGIVVPVIIDESNNILDGNHRILIAIELGILNTVKFEIKPGLNETEKRYLAYDLNLHRRHLTAEQRRQVALQMHQDGMSYRRIGDKLGVGEATVRRDIKSGASNDAPEKVNGKDGKIYPAKKKKTFQSSQSSIFTVGANQAAKTTDILKDVDTSKLPDKPMTQRRFERIAREQQTEQRRQEVIIQSPTLPSTIDIRLGDFRQALTNLPDNSIDLIFTDPPYLAEYLPLWSELASLAARVLKPGKLLIAYSGQYHLLKVMNQLAEYLEYAWLGSLKLNGPHNIVRQRKIYNDSKPLLFFSKGEYQAENFFTDFVENNRPEKDLHDWQQGIKPALYYIEQLTKSGDTILDPFLGGGTTANAAINLNRKFIGCDLDPATISTTMERLHALSN